MLHTNMRGGFFPSNECIAFFFQYYSSLIFLDELRTAIWKEAHAREKDSNCSLLNFLIGQIPEILQYENFFCIHEKFSKLPH